MKNIFYLTASLCLLLVCSNCFAEFPPEWIDNPSAVYDKDSYITAVGTGECKVYVQTVNGIWKTIKVSVK